MNYAERIIFWVVVIGLLSTVFLAGCTTTDPCVSNPRNMQCFTADELERELNQ
jgi:hypothetical protein